MPSGLSCQYHASILENREFNPSFPKHNIVRPGRTAADCELLAGAALTGALSKLVFCRLVKVCRAPIGKSEPKSPETQDSIQDSFAPRFQHKFFSKEKKCSDYCSSSPSLCSLARQPKRKCGAPMKKGNALASLSALFGPVIQLRDVRQRLVIRNQSPEPVGAMRAAQVSSLSGR